ncbi:MAG TPA: DUF4097 family beta strand repeat-containing protein [Candidatus Solibacter sp.]|jgi:hypothetical protein|nr:DUF4097 family beta strand repeat-containing protein [Candidatus Solibacter sp.]
MIKLIVRLTILACMAHGLLVFGEDKDNNKVEFKKTVAIAPADHIVLDVTVPRGDVSIQYRHAGEISITAIASTTDGKELPNDFFDTSLKVEREGQHLKIRAATNPTHAKPTVKISYKIGVPDWIEVNSNVEKDGNQMIAGVRGPVKLVTGHGDIKAMYITTTLDARTGGGNIEVIRVGTSAKVETGGGNIRMKDIGPSSSATVKKGTGRIEMDGVSGCFTGSTDAGELDAKGAAYGDWSLASTSGNIRIEVSAGEHSEEVKLDVDAATRSGKFLTENEDLKACRVTAVHECHQKVNGGGSVVRARSESGNIFFR